LKGAEVMEITVQIIQTLILFGTALVVWIYTKETKLLRKETKKQTDLMIRPFVILYYDVTCQAIDNISVGKPEVKIKNIGNGAAINVRVEDVGTNMNQTLKCTQKIDVLPPDQERVIQFVDKDEEEIPAEEWNKLFDSYYYENLDEMTEHGGEFIRIDISYFDVNITPYNNAIIISAEGTKVQ